MNREIEHINVEEISYIGNIIILSDAQALEAATHDQIALTAAVAENNDDDDDNIG